MTENKSQKMVVNRTAAIAVAIICIILAASLVSVIAVYLPMVNNLNSQITEKNTEIADLNSSKRCPTQRHNPTIEQHGAKFEGSDR
jgi:predicted PurR-regulated permease PerM